jgi:hypothetical protein
LIDLARGEGVEGEWEEDGTFSPSSLVAQYSMRYGYWERSGPTAFFAS